MSMPWDEMMDESQRHIDACVNACAGLNPEAIPSLVEAVRKYLKAPRGRETTSSYKRMCDALKAVKETSK